MVADSVSLMIGEVVTGLGVEETLDAVELWHATQTGCEIGIFTAAAHFADLEHPDILRGSGGRALPGMEQPKRLGGASRFGCGFDPTTLLPTVTVYLHLYARTDTGQVGPVARWEGEGPITAQYVRDILGPAANFVIRPVIDVAGVAPVDGYEIPDRHREAVHLRSPADVFPWASSTSRRQQVDHTKAYVPPDHGGPPGQTGLHNLGPLTQFHHRIKTFGGWQVKQPFWGIFLWRDPHGRLYLVDHTGTRRLGKSESATTPSEPPAPADLTVDIYPDDPAVELYFESHHAA